MISEKELLQSIQEHTREFVELSEEIWQYPEIAFEEKRAAALLAGHLERQGFRVKRAAGGIATAFVAEYGSGKPVLCLLGEYDALPGLSQISGLTYRREAEKGAPGHGCGHNLLGVGSLAAAVALKERMAAGELSGTVRYVGCPAEESGCGKELLTKAGIFEGADACLTWHPDSGNRVVAMPYLANIMLRISFRGKPSHAAAAPECGRSALDACELMNIGANYLREHIPPTARVHYAYTDAGGYSPNTVPESAGLLYYVRSPRISEAREIAGRLQKIARGASLMTETRLSFHIQNEMYDYVPNHTLGRVMDRAFRRAGAPDFTAQDEAGAALYRAENAPGPALSREILPYEPTDRCLCVSSDVGNVSYLVPTAQLYSCCYARDTAYHTWQLVAQSKKPAAMCGMLAAARTLALTGAELLENPALVDEARRELEETVRNR